MKRRILSLILTVLLLTSVAGCGSPAPSAGAAGPKETSESTSTLETEEAYLYPLDFVVDAIKGYIIAAGYYYDLNVLASKNAITAFVWEDGFRDAMPDSLDENREDLLSLAEQMKESVDFSGYRNTTVSLRLMDDTNLKEPLLVIMDGEIVYDASEGGLGTDFPGPVIYTGFGDDVIEIEMLDSGCAFNVIGNNADRLFFVRGYDSNGDLTGLFVNATDPYKGITVDPYQETVTMEIEGEGFWAIELLPLMSLETISVGETVTGTGDSLVRVLSFGKTATITGNEDDHHLAIRSFGADRDSFLVTSADPYEGTVVLEGHPVLLEIKTVGDWSITFDE